MLLAIILKRLLKIYASFNRRKERLWDVTTANTSIDLRPYGPQGTMVCFNCAMSTQNAKLKQSVTLYST